MTLECDLGVDMVGGVDSKLRFQLAVRIEED